VIESMFGLFMATQAAFNSTSKFLHLQLRGLGGEGNDEAAESVDDAVFMQQFGVAVRPVIARTLRVLGIRSGADIWVLKLWDKAKIPTDLEEGETRVYAVGDNTKRIRIRRTQGFSIEINGATISIDSNGKVSITPASGQDVVVNSGIRKVARVGDNVNIATISGQAGPYPVIFTVTPTDADGSPGLPSGGPSATLTGYVANGGGSPHFKTE
jgi:phage gp45-like